MVGRRVEDDTVGIRQHHAGDHTTHLFTSGKYTHFLQQLFAGKQHTSEEAFQEDLVRVGRELAQPVDQVIIRVEILGVVERQIGRRDGLSPLERSGIGLFFSVDDLEKGGHRTRVVTDEYDLVVFLHVEVEVLEKDFPVDGLCQPLYFLYLVARFAVGREQDTRIAS